jgi:DNA-binding CsgD family transcriptional regulator
MTDPVTASDQDLCTLAGIVSDDRPDLPPQGLPMSLLTDLMDQVRCDRVSFFGLDSERQAFWFEQHWPALPARSDLRVFWEHYWGSDDCSYPDRSGDLRSVIQTSDFYSARQLRSTGMYTEFCGPAGSEHELILFLPERTPRTTGPGRTVRLMFTRGPGPDFSERDRAMLTLLRPHLHQAYLDAELRRQGTTPELTRRHWELLQLIAAGHTNRQIARRLGLAEGTVRKHLENIYRRLQVTSRTAAITRAFPDGAAALDGPIEPATSRCPGRQPAHHRFR